MSFDFLSPKKHGVLGPELQIVIFCILYLTTLAVGYAEYVFERTFFGYPLSLSILFVPLYEEMLFRGLLFENCLKKYGPMLSVLFVSVLFGLWHAKNIFWLGPDRVAIQMAYTALIVSPLLCWITLKCRSVWPGVIFHYLLNILANRFLWAAIATSVSVL